MLKIYFYYAAIVFSLCW